MKGCPDFSGWFKTPNGTDSVGIVLIVVVLIATSEVLSAGVVRRVLRATPVVGADEAAVPK